VAGFEGISLHPWSGGSWLLFPHTYCVLYLISICHCVYACLQTVCVWLCTCVSVIVCMQCVCLRACVRVSVPAYMCVCTSELPVCVWVSESVCRSRVLWGAEMISAWLCKSSPSHFSTHARHRKPNTLSDHSTHWVISVCVWGNSVSAAISSPRSLALSSLLHRHLWAPVGITFI
jgi:hypothetical protein